MSLPASVFDDNIISSVSNSTTAAACPRGSENLWSTVNRRDRLITFVDVSFACPRKYLVIPWSLIPICNISRKWIASNACFCWYARNNLPFLCRDYASISDEFHRGCVDIHSTIDPTQPTIDPRSVGAKKVHALVDAGLGSDESLLCSVQEHRSHWGSPFVPVPRASARDLHCKVLIACLRAAVHRGLGGTQRRS